MIDVQNEQVLTLSAAAREVPNRKSGRGVSASAAWRWAMRGLKGVRLETVVVGGIRMTSREALQRFFERLTVASDDKAPIIRTSRQRQRDYERAKAELEANGI